MIYRITIQVQGNDHLEPDFDKLKAVIKCMQTIVVCFKEKDIMERLSFQHPMEKFLLVAGEVLCRLNNSLFEPKNLGLRDGNLKNFVHCSEIPLFK